MFFFIFFSCAVCFDHTFVYCQPKMPEPLSSSAPTVILPGLVEAAGDIIGRSELGASPPEPTAPYIPLELQVSDTTPQTQAPLAVTKRATEDDIFHTRFFEARPPIDQVLSDLYENITNVNIIQRLRTESPLTVVDTSRRGIFQTHTLSGKMLALQFREELASGTFAGRPAQQYDGLTPFQVLCAKFADGLAELDGVYPDGTPYVPFVPAPTADAAAGEAQCSFFIDWTRFSCAFRHFMVISYNEVAALVPKALASVPEGVVRLCEEPGQYSRISPYTENTFNEAEVLSRLSRPSLRRVQSSLGNAIEVLAMQESVTYANKYLDVVLHLPALVAKLLPGASASLVQECQALILKAAEQNAR